MVSFMQRGQKSSVSSMSSHQSNLAVHKSTRPESDEYVELRQDKNGDFPHLQVRSERKHVLFICF